MSSISPVFLTVCSVQARCISCACCRKKEDRRQVEMHWNWSLFHEQAESGDNALKSSTINLLPVAGDWVGLFNQELQVGSNLNSKPLVQISLNSAHTQRDSTGYKRTKYLVNLTKIQERRRGGNSDPNLGYWIAHIRENQIVYINSLRLYPNWMYENREYIGHIPLHTLMLPGTHDSGTWSRGAKACCCRNFIINQDESVYLQLLSGIRYLDLRVAHYGGKKKTAQQKYWINHDCCKIRPLSSLLAEVRQFIQETGGRELLILDFHRFPVGFTGKKEKKRPNFEEEKAAKHAELVELIKSEIGQYLIPKRDFKMNLNDIWTLNKCIIITYADGATVGKYPEYLWGGISQAWADKKKLGDLKEYIEQSINSKKGTVWAAMAQFTPTPKDVVCRSCIGLRHMARKVNPALCHWCRFHAQWRDGLSIVACDFFLGNDIIHLSIEINKTIRARIAGGINPTPAVSRTAEPSSMPMSVESSKPVEETPLEMSRIAQAVEENVAEKISSVKLAKEISNKKRRSRSRSRSRSKLKNKKHHPRHHRTSRHSSKPDS